MNKVRQKYIGIPVDKSRMLECVVSTPNWSHCKHDRQHGYVNIDTLLFETSAKGYEKLFFGYADIQFYSLEEFNKHCHTTPLTNYAGRDYSNIKQNGRKANQRPI